MPTFAALLSMVVVVAAAIIAAGATTAALFVGVVLTAGGLAMGWKLWTDSGVPKSPLGWFAIALGALAVGSGVYAVECLVGSLGHPELAFLEAGLRTGPFGGICTIVVTGWLVLFAIGGAAYSGTRNWMGQKARDRGDVA